MVGLQAFSPAPVVTLDHYVPMTDLPALGAERRIGAALVIGLPSVVGPLQDIGLPVLFVDSLPYLWTVNDEVAVTADCYLAQRCTVIPQLAWPVLRSIPNLNWIEAIVPGPPSVRHATRRLPGRCALVNVGGLHSAFSGDASEAYVDAVIPATVRGLESAGFRIQGVCGNLSAAAAARIRESARGLLPHVGPLSHERFAALARDVDLVVTSPGSTTVLQAYSAGKPVLLLPPQNVSQVLNVRQLALGRESRCAIGWPVEVFDEEELEAVRESGEEAAVAVLYDVSRRACRSTSSIRSIEDRVAQLARDVDDADVVRPYLDMVGTRGAAQVAERLRRQLSAAP
jgi:hydroxymethylcytosylglucuronate/cytosylglucuronate synthase